MFLLSLLPLVFFGLLWLFFSAGQESHAGDADWRRPLVLAGLFCSGFLALGTELLSLLRALTPAGAAGLWLAGIAVLGLLQWHSSYVQRGYKAIRRSFADWQPGTFGWLMITFSVAALLVLLITGLLSPPNIHDVLAYHMSRVMHWAQNHSLAFYPTPNTWQLWMPPFSEFSQLHWTLLAGSDWLTFFPQWYSLILAMAAVSLTARRLGAGAKGQWLAAIFVLTLPIIVLQASGRKNDIVLGFFFAALLYFVVESSSKKLSWLERAACGLSVGLGVLTKGSFPVFVLPFFAWMLVNILRRSGWKSVLAFVALGLACMLALNGGHWIRNTLTFGNPIFSGDAGPVINGRFGVRVTLSNLVRSSAVQLNGRYGFINEAVQKAVYKIHDWMNMPVFDPEITQGPGEFYYVPNREEVAGNPLHFALAGISLIVLLFSLVRKESRKTSLVPLWLAMGGVLSLTLFSAVFRWQSWNTRLLIPYYLALAPVVGIAFGQQLPKPAAWLTAIALGIVLVNPLLNNYSRSFSWAEENRNSIWRLSRKGLLFANNQAIEGAVIDLADLMKESDCRTYGVLMRRNAPEYLLWAVLQPGPQAYELRHIHVDNQSAIHSSPDFDPCGIILFEMIETNLVDQSVYELAQNWQVDDTTPFSLFLKPGFRIEGLE